MPCCHRCTTHLAAGTLYFYGLDLSRSALSRLVALGLVALALYVKASFERFRFMPKGNGVFA